METANRTIKACALAAPRRVGLMGGSFNPAHEGHVHISRLALQRLDLEQIWWLVARQNPLKPAAGMAGLDQRIRTAKAVACGHPAIRISDIEYRLGTRYTADTLAALDARGGLGGFVWIMGADNLLQIERWRNWPSIFRRIPVAIFARSPYSNRIVAAKAARRFARFRIAPTRARNLANMAPPAWAFFHVPLNAQSATRIRAG